jgi:hypothetical protein
MMSGLFRSKFKVSASERLQLGSAVSLKPNYPSAEQLVWQAQRTTESCIFHDQIDITRQFYKRVALRGGDQKKYTQEEVLRIGFIVDFMAQNKFKQIESQIAV